LVLILEYETISDLYDNINIVKYSDTRIDSVIEIARRSRTLDLISRDYMLDDRHAENDIPFYSTYLKERLSQYLVDITHTSTSLANFMAEIHPSSFLNEPEILYRKQLTPGPITNPYDVEERTINQWTFIHLMTSEVAGLIVAPTKTLDENQALAVQEIISNGLNDGLIAIKNIGKDYKVLEYHLFLNFLG
jgi:hypothetical protein